MKDNKPKGSVPGEDLGALFGDSDAQRVPKSKNQAMITIDLKLKDGGQFGMREMIIWDTPTDLASRLSQTVQSVASHLEKTG